MTAYPTFGELDALLRSLRPFLLDPTSAGEVIIKNRNDFVTAADMGVQTRLREELNRRYPDFAFMGEEDSDHTVNAHVPTFILDPIDGTTNYIFGYGLSVVSLALCHEGEAKIGAVYNPYTDELFYAERGKGATLNGKPMHVLEADSPADVVAAIGSMPYRKEYADELFTIARALYLDCIDIRRSGSAAVDCCYAAAGRVGLYAERGLKVWDYAASTVIIEEAGGKITDWSGNPVPLFGGSSVAVSNGRLHDYLLHTLQSNLKFPL